MQESYGPLLDLGRNLLLLNENKQLGHSAEHLLLCSMASRIFRTIPLRQLAASGKRYP